MMLYCVMISIQVVSNYNILSCSKAIRLSRGNVIHLFYTLHERSQLITVSSKHFTATNHATNLIQATELHQSHHFVVS